MRLSLDLICAIIQYEKVPVARQIVAVYIELSRNTPLLVQLFFIYYGLPKIGIQTDPQTCGVAGLTFLGGSYMAEAFRSGLETVAADSDRKRIEPRHEPSVRLCGTWYCHRHFQSVYRPLWQM